MINIGRKKILEMINEMELSREETARRIGLSKGGLYYVTHKSGKMTNDVWKKFKDEYTKITGKNVEADIEIRSKPKRDLSEVTLDELLTEIVDRGWEVTFKKISNK